MTAVRPNEPPFPITVCGIEELDGHGATAATHVLSILDPDHPVPVAFGAWGEHEKLELRFHDLIEPDRERRGPMAEDVEAVLALGRDVAAEPGRVRLLVHCHAGISRSTAAMMLILAVALPETPAETIAMMVHGIRDKAWPNLAMIELGDAMLGRGGSLVQAAQGLHQAQLARRPELEGLMRGFGRDREVDSARRALGWDVAPDRQATPSPQK